MIRKTKAPVGVIEKRIFALLVFSILVLVSFYIYFVSRSVVNVLVREELEKNISSLHSRLADLEGEYLAKKEHVDLDLAHSMGFTTIAAKTYVKRDTALTLQTESAR